MAKERVMTAPLAIIKSNGVAIGKMKSLRCTETIRRQKVTGLGRLTPSEYAPTDWEGNLNCGAYLISLKKSIIPGAILRRVQTVQEWEDTLVLSTDGVQVDIMRKVLESTAANGVKKPKIETFVSIKGAFANRESFDISEGQLGGRDADFNYSTPFLFPQ